MSALSDITEAHLLAQERRFAEAFAARDIGRTRPLYDPAVVYISPTVRLFDWPARIEGVDRTLEFIQLTIDGLADIHYEAVEWGVWSEGSRAFVRIHFDWTSGAQRWRSNYVVIYRYHAGRIQQQELYYDPSGRLERLATPTT
jgi:SnoaL-like protein